MLAEVHDRVGGEASPQPRIEREVVVRRHQVGIVVGRLGVDAVAPRRLDADDDVAEAVDGKAESFTIEERVVFGLAPSRDQCVARGRREGVEEGVVVGEAKGDLLSCSPLTLRGQLASLPRREALSHKGRGTARRHRMRLRTSLLREGRIRGAEGASEFGRG